MNPMQDILDLCKLNQMEENVRKTSALDTPATLDAIDYKRSQIAQRLRDNPPTVVPGVMERHLADNTIEE
jgi:hypothetical protein